MEKGLLMVAVIHDASSLFPIIITLPTAACAFFLFYYVFPQIFYSQAFYIFSFQNAFAREASNIRKISKIFKHYRNYSIS